MITPPPAEWAPQARMFTALPSHADLWEDDLAAAQSEVAAMVNALVVTTPVTLLADGADAVATASRLCPQADVRDIPFGDIWLRDTGPIFTARDACARFAFNGWGGKYDLPGDDSVGAHVAGLASAAVRPFPFVLEGGAIDGDGQGLMLTTEQCLLNPNRNPGWDRKTAEAALADALGARRIVWLGEGLVGDHTDGHVDNLARFVGAGTVAIPQATTPDDPNAAIYADAVARVRAAGLVVVPVPSVGLLLDDDGQPVPASHMNWLVSNGQVLVPLYGTASDPSALKAIARLFPRHRVTGLAASHILTGGGSLHCITQQQPA